MSILAILRLRSIRNNVSTRDIAQGILYGSPPGIVILYIFNGFDLPGLWYGIFFLFSFLIFSVILPIRLIPIIELMLRKFSQKHGKDSPNELEKHLGTAILLSCISTLFIAVSNNLFVGIVTDEYRSLLSIFLSIFDSIYYILLGITWGFFSGMMTYTSLGGSFWIKLNKAKTPITRFILVGWLVPIIILTIVMIHLYILPRQVTLSWESMKDIWLELTPMIIIASIIAMLPFPLFFDLIKSRSNKNRKERPGPAKDKWRNKLVSFYAIITGMLIILIFVKDLMSLIESAYEISQPDVVAGGGAFVGPSAVLAVYIITYALVIVFMTISPKSTNWSSPRQIGTTELIRRTIGFISFILGIGNYYPIVSWILAVSGLIVLLSPNSSQVPILDTVREGLIE
jgi:hypothetical protein